MATIQDILTRKGTQVTSIAAEASVLEAAILMNAHKIGCLVVMDGQFVSGIFSERDVLRRVVAERRDPAAVRVCEVMTKEVVCCQPETDVNEARSVFRHRRIRHLPVLDCEEKLVGLVSIGDLNAFDADVQESTIHLLHEYIYGSR